MRRKRNKTTARPLSGSASTAPPMQAAHTVAVEVWRSWGQTPLRGIAVDAFRRRYPRWPGILLLALSSRHRLSACAECGGAHRLCRSPRSAAHDPQLPPGFCPNCRPARASYSPCSRSRCCLGHRAAWSLAVPGWRCSLTCLSAAPPCGAPQSSWPCPSTSPSTFPCPATRRLDRRLAPGGHGGGGGQCAALRPLKAHTPKAASVTAGDSAGCWPRSPGAGRRLRRRAFCRRPSRMAHRLPQRRPLRHAPRRQIPGFGEPKPRSLADHGRLGDGRRGRRRYPGWRNTCRQAPCSFRAEGVYRIRAFYGSPNNLALYLERTFLAALAWAAFFPPDERACSVRWPRACKALRCSSPSAKAAVPGRPRRPRHALGGRAAHPAQPGRSAASAVAGRRRRSSCSGAPTLPAHRTLPAAARLLAGTGYLRLQLWRSAWQMALDHPWLGVGPDNFLYAYRSFYLLPQAGRSPTSTTPTTGPWTGGPVWASPALPSWPWPGSPVWQGYGAAPVMSHARPPKNRASTSASWPRPSPLTHGLIDASYRPARPNARLGAAADGKQHDAGTRNALRRRGITASVQFGQRAPGLRPILAMPSARVTLFISPVQMWRITPSPSMK